MCCWPSRLGCFNAVKGCFERIPIEALVGVFVAVVCFVLVCPSSTLPSPIPSSWNRTDSITYNHCCSSYKKKALHLHHHPFLNREGRCDTTDSFTTSFLHYSLFSTALWNLAKSRSVHSLITSSYLFFSLPCLLPPFTVPCRMVFGQTWRTWNMSILLQFASLYDGQDVFVWSDCLLELGTDFIVGNVVFGWDKSLALKLYFFMVATKLLAKSCRRPSWSLWRHGRGLAGAGDISHRIFFGWKCALWCFFLLWSLPVLQQWSCPLVASVCSVWSSAWLCLDGWWGWSFGSSGTAAGCLSWDVWWTRTGSMGLAILLSAKSCCRLSWERRLHPLHLLGPVLLGCCQLQLTSLSSMIVLHLHVFPNDGMVVLSVSLSSGYSSVLMDLHLPRNCAAQSSILSIGSVSLVLLCGISRTILDSSSFPLFPGGVKHAAGASSKIRGNHISFGTWNARTLWAAGTLKKLTHEKDRYRWNILWLCEMRWKHFNETTTEEEHKVFISGKEDKFEHGVGFIKDIVTAVMGCHPVSSKLISIYLRAIPVTIITYIARQNMVSYASPVSVYGNVECQ